MDSNSEYPVWLSCQGCRILETRQAGSTGILLFADQAIRVFGTAHYFITPTDWFHASAEMTGA